MNTTHIWILSKLCINILFQHTIYIFFHLLRRLRCEWAETPVDGGRFHFSNRLYCFLCHKIKQAERGMFWSFLSFPRENRLLLLLLLMSNSAESEVILHCFGVVWAQNEESFFSAASGHRESVAIDTMMKQRSDTPGPVRCWHRYSQLWWCQYKDSWEQDTKGGI